MAASAGARRRDDHRAPPAAQPQRAVRGRRPAASLLPAGREARGAPPGARRGGDERQPASSFSAPTARRTRGTPRRRACGCAGIYTAHAGIELYAEAFAAAGALDRLDDFAGRHGAAVLRAAGQPGEDHARRGGRARCRRRFRSEPTRWCRFGPARNLRGGWCKPGGSPGRYPLDEASPRRPASCAIAQRHYSRLDLPGGDLWIFGYGSLMWNPGIPYVRWAPALVFGYHRALCIYSSRWRGTPERPGLVLGLDRGGCCRGIAFQVKECRGAVRARDAVGSRDAPRRVPAAAACGRACRTARRECSPSSPIRTTPATPESSRLRGWRSGSRPAAATGAPTSSISGAPSITWPNSACATSTLQRVLAVAARYLLGTFR